MRLIKCFHLFIYFFSLDIQSLSNEKFEALYINQFYTNTKQSIENKIITAKSW